MKISIANRARLAFAIMVLLVLVAGSIWYYQTSGRFTTYQILTQDPVSGLIAGAPVEFHGVDVGRVTQVELTGPRSIRILLDADKDAPITRATVATITARGLATRGFTGYVYILLEDVGTDQRPLTAAPGDRYPRIPATPFRSVNLDTAISQVNQNVQLLTELLHTLLDEETISSFKDAVDNLQQVSRMLAKNQERLGSIIVNTEQASGRLGPLLDSSNDTINALQLQVLPEAYRSIANLNRLADSMNRLTVKINRDPSILVRSSTPPPLGPGETR